MTPRSAYIALNLMEGLGPVKVRALLERLGSAEAVFTASEEVLRQAPGIGAVLAGALVRRRGEVDPEAEERTAKKRGERLITPADGDYPELLRAIHDPPLVLYVRGALAPADRHALAVVGSRRATHYGRAAADRLAYQLAQVGYTIVSGLARGIDAAAHRGALKAGGRTLAVLGSALDRMYPPEHAGLADEIAASGAVVSEYAYGREPDRTTFPYRNRVVSGLSLGVLVVEAPPKSGALMTADQALDQGRSVFAVPGRIDQLQSRGCHRLIKAGARLVEGIDDVLEEFEMLLPPERRARAEEVLRRPDVPLSADEASLVRVLGEGSLDVDELARRAGLPSSAVSGILLGLEMKRVVVLQPGRIVELVVRLEEIRG